MRWVKFSDHYEVSDYGEIRSLDRISGPNKKFWPSKILRPGKSGLDRKYCFVFIHERGAKKMQYIHRIVAKAFIPNPHNLPQVNHKNGKKDDNRAENLEWCTISQNQIHAYKNLNRHRVSPIGELHPNCKIGLKQIMDIIYRYENKITKAKDLAIEFGVNRNFVYGAKRRHDLNKTEKYISYLKNKIK